MGEEGKKEGKERRKGSEISTPAPLSDSLPKCRALPSLNEAPKKEWWQHCQGLHCQQLQGQSNAAAAAMGGVKAI